MAMISAYGLDDCSVQADLGFLGIANNYTIQTGAGRFGGTAISPPSSSSAAFPANLPVSANFGFGFYCQFVASSGSPTPELHIGTSAFSTVAAAGRIVVITPTLIQVYAGVNPGSNPLVAQVATTAFSDLRPHWVEITRQSTDIVIYLDDIEILRTPKSGVSFGNPYIYMAQTSFNQIRVDDLITWDSSGSNYNTFPIHPQRIVSLNPTAAGDLAQWTPTGTANNWDAAAKTTYSGTITKQLDTTTSGATDLYNFADMPYSPFKVHGVLFKMFGSESGSLSSNVSAMTKNTGVSRALGSIPLSVGANAVRSVWSTQDANNLDWTFATVNSSQFGVRSDL